MKRNVGLVVAGGVVILVATSLSLVRRAAPTTGERVNVFVPLTYQHDRRVLIGSESIRIDAIHAAPQMHVILSGEHGVRLDEVTEVMDALKAAGVERIALR